MICNKPKCLKFAKAGHKSEGQYLGFWEAKRGEGGRDMVQTNICDSRVAFATKHVVMSLWWLLLCVNGIDMHVGHTIHISIQFVFWIRVNIFHFSSKMKNNTTINITDVDEKQNFNRQTEDPGYIALEISQSCFLIYCLVTLIKIRKKHKENIQPVHIITTMALFDITCSFTNFCLYDLLLLSGYDGLEHFQITFGFVLWLWFILDVSLQDVDAFFYVGWGLNYHDWITNVTATVAVIRKGLRKT